MDENRLHLGDRVQVHSMLLVVCFVAVLALNSQSAASFPTYVLCLSMLFSVGKWSDVFRVPLFWLVSTLVVYLVMSSFWSQGMQPRQFFSIFVRGLLVACFVVAFAECQLRGLLQKWLARMLAIVGALAVLGAVYFYLQNPPEDGRIQGLGQLHNQVVAALVFGVVLIFVLEAYRRERALGWLVFSGISLALCAVAIALTDSRNAWISVVTGVCVYAMAHRVVEVQKFVAGLASVLVVIVSILAATLLSDTTRELALPRGFSYRPEIWQATFDKLEGSALWFGAGVLSDDNVRVAGMEFLHPHSMYLSVFYQAGAVGAVLLLLLICASLRVLLQHYEQADAKLALSVFGVALPAYLLDGHSLIDKIGLNWFLFWMPVAISLGLAWSNTLRRY